MENVEEKRKAIMDFVNSRVNKNSNISDETGIEKTTVVAVVEA